MKKFITVVSLGMGLAALSGGAAAQEDVIPVINADGNNVTSTAGVNPVADAGGPTIVYGDLNPGPGNTVIGAPVEGPAPVSADLPPPPGTTENLSATDGNAAILGPGDASAAPGTVTRDGSSGMSLLGPDGTYSVTEVSPSNVSVGETGVVEPEPAPVAVAEPVASTETVEPVVADTAVATETDLDADNYPDAQEWDLGLDPGNADTDGDGVADGDELNIYGTEPTAFDTDGDGLSDGRELFATGTNPVTWDTNGDGLGDGESVNAESTVPVDPASGS